MVARLACALALLVATSACGEPSGESSPPPGDAPPASGAELSEDAASKPPPKPALPRGVSGLDGPTFVVASDLDHAPFAYVEGTEPHGSEVDLMETVSRMLGRPLRWERMPFAEIFDAVAEGEVDAACATLGISPEREQRFLFSRPYYETTIAVLVRAGENEPTTLADLAGARVHASAGTTSETAARAHLAEAELVLEPGKDGASVSERLLAGEIDAAVMDGIDAELAVAAADGALCVLDETLAEERYAILLPAGADDLKRRIDQILQRLDQLGQLDLYLKRHGLLPW